jgi:integrase
MVSAEAWPVDRYVEQVRAGLAPTTARGWSTYLSILAKEFQGRRLDEVLTTELAALAQQIQTDALRRAVSRDGLSAREGFITAARAVWRRAIADDLTKHNPALAVAKPARTRARERRGLTPAEVAELWESIALRTADPELGLTVLRLALETGMRRAEMLGLTAASMEKASGCIRVEIGAKNGSHRQQPVTVTLFDTLTELAASRHGRKLCPTDPLLVNRRGQPITRRWFENTAARVRADVPGLGPGGDLWFTWHLTRHTAGARIERVAGYSVAAKFLGHTPSGRSGVTVLYTQATLDEVRLAVKKVWQEPMAGM